MRIRKCFPPSYFASMPISDLQLNRSLLVQHQIQSLSHGNPPLPEAKPNSCQPSDPPDQPSDYSTAIRCENIRYVHPIAVAGQIAEQKEIADETWREEDNPSTNDNRKESIVIQQVDVQVLQPSSSSDRDGRWSEGDKVVPLKKRKGTTDNTANNETLTKARMKSKTNQKCVQQNDDQLCEAGISKYGNGNSSGNKGKRGNVIMEGSRCSRVNGRGWRCCQPTLVGYALCEHHLGKGRLRSMSSVRNHSMINKRGAPHENVDSKRLSSLKDEYEKNSSIYNDEEKPLMVTKKRTKLGIVKARSINSLLGLIDSAVVLASDNSPTSK